jgi:hypothetical protein
LNSFCEYKQIKPEKVHSQVRKVMTLYERLQQDMHIGREAFAWVCANVVIVVVIFRIIPDNKDVTYFREMQVPA